jgi:hypothetical protein
MTVTRVTGASTFRNCVRICNSTRTFVHVCILNDLKLNNRFPGGQPHQGIYKIQRFGDQLHLHHQGDKIRLCTELPLPVIFQYTITCHHPDDGEAVGLRNVGSFKSFDATVRPRNLY